MRKLFLLLTAFLYILVSGCSNKPATISPTASFPNSISNYFDSDEGIMLFYVKNKATYISVTTNSTITSVNTSFEDGLSSIYVTTDKTNLDTSKTIVYKVAFPKNSDTVQLYLNGSTVPFKNIVGL